MPDSPFDALLPPDMAKRGETLGERKANMDLLSMLALGMLAGAFIAMGAVFSTTVAAGVGALPYGVGRLLVGLSFCLGLILVIVAGAELFTGNTLIAMAWASGRVSTRLLVRNWAIVYAGNFIGATATALLMAVSRQYTYGGGAVGQAALNVANAKSGLGFFQAVALGIFCNALVTVAVWLTWSGRSTTDKILCIIFPITAFVAAGFEHSIANMYYIPFGLLIKSDAGFLAKIGVAASDFGNLTVYGFLVRNLLPVTIGNIIGGSVMVGLVYWFIYLRPLRKQRQQEQARLQQRQPQAGA